MALTATIFKVTLQIADMDRGYYADHTLTLARHPSETDERMMVRLVAFALYAGEFLNFTKGLCADDEPDLWQKGLTGEIKLWIDVGLPDERRIRKACNRSDQVILFAYGGRGVQNWWARNGSTLQRHNNLTVLELTEETTSALATLVQRSMQINCTVQDGQLWIGDASHGLSVSPISLMTPEPL
jgi:uncharacterized protein YaeQ